MFKKGTGNWTQYRSLPNAVEQDLHFSEPNRHQSERTSYDEKMGDIESAVLKALQDAYKNGVSYVIFKHGWSTSRPGKTTVRSVVRGLMRSKEATPYIIRRECIQHDSVFVAAICRNTAACAAGAGGAHTITTPT